VIVDFQQVYVIFEHDSSRFVKPLCYKISAKIDLRPNLQSSEVLLN